MSDHYAKNTGNRLTHCLHCGGLLRAGKSPVVSESGFIYRTRTCQECGMLVYTKQGPEEVTGVEKREGIA